MSDNQTELWVSDSSLRNSDPEKGPLGRYAGKSTMWIRRRMQSDGFPAPTYFGRTRHWRLSEIIAWENEQAKTAAPKMSHGFHKESA